LAPVLGGLELDQTERLRKGQMSASAGSEFGFEDVPSLENPWNVGLATVLVVLVFGWTGGKLLVGDAYADAKGKVAQQKVQRSAKRARRRAEAE
jgi:hypothetical protein